MSVKATKTKNFCLRDISISTLLNATKEIKEGNLDVINLKTANGLNPGVISQFGKL